MFCPPIPHELSPCKQLSSNTFGNKKNQNALLTKEFKTYSADETEHE